MPEKQFSNTWVIGGGSIYQKYLEEKNVTDIHVTKIGNDYDCDVFFPEIPSDFSIVDKNETIENENLLEFIHYSKS